MADGPANPQSFRDRLRHPGAPHAHPHPHAPSQAHAPSRGPNSRAVGGLHNITSDDTDSLADLFLGDAPLGPAAPAPSAPPRTPPPAPVAPTPTSPRTDTPASAATGSRIEGLLVGHLPVLASAWVTQYAAWKAAGSVVALVRSSPQSLTVDLFGSAAMNSPVSPSAETALAAARRAHLCLIATDDLAESELAGLRPLTALTLLTAANDAAVLAAYRMLRALAWHPSLAPTITEIRVCIMGSPEPAARAAADRLTKASASFLGLPLVIEIGPHRIVPTAATPNFSGPASLPLSAILTRLRPALPEPDVRVHVVTPRPPERVDHT